MDGRKNFIVEIELCRPSACSFASGKTTGWLDGSGADGNTLSLGFNLTGRPADLASLQRKLDAGRRKHFVRQTELHRPPAYSFAFRQNWRRGWGRGRQIDCIVSFNTLDCLPHVLLVQNVLDEFEVNEADRFYRYIKCGRRPASRFACAKCAGAGR